MLEENEAVITEEAAPSTDETVNQETAQTPAAETSPQETVQETVETVSEVDERGIPWRNRAMEAERKLQEFPSTIPKIVDEVLSKQQQQQAKPQTYTKEHIPMLKQYAADNPQYAAWVDQQIEDIRSNEQASLVRRELEGFKKEQTAAQIRQQSENYVINHPVFKDCFISDSTGAKQWNMANPLTQIMANVLNTVDAETGRMVKDRPDGLIVAAEIAYGRMSLAQRNQTGKTVQTLKKDLKKAQKATMYSGAGTTPAQPSRNAVQKSLDNYSKSYNKKDMSSAVRAHLSSIGMIKED